MHCVHVGTNKIVVYVVGWHASKQSSRGVKCLCVCVCLSCIHCFLLIFRLSFFSPPKVSAVILAICLLSCHTCLLSFQRSGRQTERGEGESWKGSKKMGSGADCSWLAAVCVLWIAYECKGSAAFLTAWQKKRCNAWNDGRIDGCRLWKLSGDWLLSYSIYPTDKVFA